MPPPVIKPTPPKPTPPKPTPPKPTPPKPANPPTTTPRPAAPAPPPPPPERNLEKSIPVNNVVNIEPEITTKKPTPPSEKYLPPSNTYLPPVVTPAPALKGNYITKELPPITQPKLTPTTPKPVPKAQPPKPIVPKPAAPKAEIKPTPKPAAPKAEPKPTPKPVAPKVEPVPTPAIFKKPIVVAPIPEEPKSNCEINGCVSQSITIKNPPVPDTCEAKCCSDDDAIPKLVIPINLGGGKAGSCPRFAKLVVPADSVGMESLKTLLSNPTELAKTLIKSLS